MPLHFQKPLYLLLECIFLPHVYENQKIQFQKDSEEIAETQIQIVYWDSIDAKNQSEALSLMADALINSEQKFIDFNK